MAVGTVERLARQDEPFYLQVGFHEPHRVATPGDDDAMGFAGGYIQPDDQLGVTVPGYLRDTESVRAELAELQGAVRYLDASAGQLLDAVRWTGVDDRTAVLFTTDHGLAFPRAKCSLYDPGIEVSLLLRYPARGWTGGRLLDQLTSNLDLFPTLLELAGLPVSSNVHGRSLAALLDGAIDSHRDAVFAEMTYHDYYHPQRAVRTLTHKLIVNFSTAPSFMDPSQSWQRRARPIVPANPATTYTPAIELYDLQADPLETQSLADLAEHAEVRGELLAQVSRWMRETGDPLLQGAVTSPRHREAVAALVPAS
jgi:arylsulfatase A-like enzyme